MNEVLLYTSLSLFYVAVGVFIGTVIFGIIRVRMTDKESQNSSTVNKNE